MDSLDKQYLLLIFIKKNTVPLEFATFHAKRDSSHITPVVTPRFISHYPCKTRSIIIQLYIKIIQSHDPDDNLYQGQGDLILAFYFKVLYVFISKSTLISLSFGFYRFIPKDHSNSNQFYRCVLIKIFYSLCDTAFISKRGDVCGLTYCI